MSILTKILPIILISIIFYILLNNIYPKYQDVLDLTKKLSALNNKQKQISDLKSSIQSLSKISQFQQLLSQKETLNVWLPVKPQVEEIIYNLSNLYNFFKLEFQGTDFEISTKEKKSDEFVLSPGTINFRLSVNLPFEKLLIFIDYLEKNVRLMSIKKATIYSDKPAILLVESYYLPHNK